MLVSWNVCNMSLSFLPVLLLHSLADCQIASQKSIFADQSGTKLFSIASLRPLTNLLIDNSNQSFELLVLRFKVMRASLYVNLPFTDQSKNNFLNDLLSEKVRDKVRCGIIERTLFRLQRWTSQKTRFCNFVDCTTHNGFVRNEVMELPSPWACLSSLHPTLPFLPTIFIWLLGPSNCVDILLRFRLIVKSIWTSRMRRGYSSPAGSTNIRYVPLLVKSLNVCSFLSKYSSTN